MAKIKKEKVKEKENWVSFDYPTYEIFIRQLVHLSVKAVNSNAIAGGVRLSESVDLPYISASTVVLNLVNLDYTKAGGRIARIAKQVNTVLNESHQERFNVVPEQEVEWIKAVHATLAYANITSEVDCHIKQVLMHNGAEDVSLSPLHSAGLCALLNMAEEELIATQNAEIALNNESLPESKKQKVINRLVPRIEMNFGGANPQNVGSLIRAMQHPIFVLPPKESHETSRVFAVHYKGIKIENNALIDQLLLLTDALHKKLAEGSPSQMEDRDAIENQLVLIVQDAKKRASEGLVLLNANKDLLPTDDDNKAVLLSDKVLSNKLQAGFILEDLRQASWRKEFSQYLVKKIRDRKRWMRTTTGENVEIGTGITGAEAESFRSIIENEVRK